jgi:hypothetical protein
MDLIVSISTVAQPGTSIGSSEVRSRGICLSSAQQPSERMRRIGVLMPNAADDPEYQARVTAFLQGLA